ncbi:MAG: hypothetical protein U0796_23300 [Gemmatales bacterium]
MNRLCLSLALVLPVLFSLPGCKLLMDTNPEKPVIQAPPLKVTQKVTPVTPDEITPANAKSKARQLLDEMENDTKE